MNGEIINQFRVCSELNRIQNRSALTKVTQWVSVLSIVIAVMISAVSNVIAQEADIGSQVDQGHNQDRIFKSTPISNEILFPDPNDLITGAEVTGELRQWHKVTLTIDGPRASQYGRTVLDYDEEADVLHLDVRKAVAGPSGRLGYMHPNPFLDYRMTVSFTHESGEPSYEVPGYFAADGNAAETSAISGNKWRAHLSPDKPGRWDWQVSFVAGVGVSIDKDAPSLSYVPYDGLNGSFNVAETDKSYPDFRARGRLQYVGEHYLRFAGNGEYFLKAGADAPETLLAYADFDGTYTMMEPDGRGWIGPADGHGLHEYAAHKQDWQEGDPTWKDGKGRGLIGAINYLSGKGMNAMSFIPYTAGGDGENVWPWVSRNESLHYDVSKLDQWEIVFEHAQQRGVFLHFKLIEQENDAGYPYRVRRGPSPTVPEALDWGAVGPERKLYTREMIARFGHHLALNWNLGEETSMSIENIREWADVIADTDNDNSRYCFAKAGDEFVVYLTEGGTTDLDMSGFSGTFDVSWYDPRNGGDLQTGSVTSVSGGRSVSLGTAPSYDDEDWTILVRRR